MVPTRPVILTRLARADMTRWARARARRVVGRFSVWPPVGFVRLGSLRRTSPIAPMWPPRFGRPIDRFYIDAFFEAEAAAIRGDVLEVGDLDYTTRFGGPDVTEASILHAPVGAGPEVRYKADLADAPELPSAAFDCVVLPQTLLFIYDVAAAVRTLHRILRPGGAALITVPGITQIVPDDAERWGQYWSFTTDSVGRLFGDVFGDANTVVRSRGNVQTATAFLHGLVVEDLRRSAFADDDPAYPLVLTVRAVRAS